MGPEANVERAFSDKTFPHADTQAARMLQSALDEAKAQNKTSLRSIAKTLGYKQAAVLSHMASGRIPIPIARAEDIATALDINPAIFMKMVLNQRHPSISVLLDGERTNQFSLESQFDDTGFGRGLRNAKPSQMRIIQEVLRDVDASERWISIPEVYLVKLIRQLRPDVVSEGLSRDDLQRLSSALAPATKQQQSDN